jgi:hypothetical protein
MQITGRRAALFAGFGAALAFTGCEREPKPSSTATLLNNEEVHNAVKVLIDAVDGLGSDIGQFDTEDWKDVVPEVRTAAANVESALASLRQALGYSDASG